MPIATCRTGEATTFMSRLVDEIGRATWVKGAVNYDEDLHFSTYYLRASCSSATRPLYPGYSTFVASYEGFKETYWLLESECRDTSAAIVAKAVSYTHLTLPTKA